jgi:hypothetical protein
MRNALKGALLSGLVLPGLGQVVLKSYKRGVALMLAVLAAFFVIVVKTVQQSLAILEKVAAEGGPVDMESVSNAAAQSATAADSLIVTLAFWFIVLCWIGGTVDAYYTGKKKDLADQP